MAQAFVTTYKNHYRWNIMEKRDMIKPHDPCADKPPEGDMWLTMDDFGLPKDSAEKTSTEAERMVKELYKERMRTTYQLHYCGLGAVRKPVSERDDNELLEYCRNLYDRRKGKKILPPLPSSKRVYGYMRPSRIYAPLTVYQQVHGKLGYDVMKPTTIAEEKDNEKTEGEVDGDVATPKDPKTKVTSKSQDVLLSTKSLKQRSDKSNGLGKRKLKCECCKCHCKKHFEAEETKST